jgi:TonB family protein
MKAPLSLSFLVVIASVLDGQSRASRQIDSAYAQATAGRLDSAAALLRPVLDTSIPSKRDERAVALVVYGVVEFFRGRDSAAASAFRDALGIRIDIKGDLMSRFDPALALIWRRERARAICGTPEPVAVDFLAPDTTGVGSPASVLTERPRVLSGPTLRYPEHLRRARIQGRVVVAGVIDTSGQAERGSVRVVESAHPGFNGQATYYLERAKFRPGRIGTRPVRVCVEMPVDFRLRQ